MATEIELKLGLTPEQHVRFTASPLLASAHATSTETLISTYYDTSNQQLLSRGYSIRIRQNGSQFYQTLKTSQGLLKNGLHQRQEWEIPIPTNLLDFAAFPVNVCDAIQDLQDKLQPIFVTHFVRRNWEIVFDHTEVIISLDHGKIIADQHTLPISEIEIELKQGDANMLSILAEKLRQPALPLPPLKDSKAKRGYQLLSRRSG